MRLEERIKQLRINRNMTMQQLADLSNLTKGYISMLERGLNPSTKKPIVPSLETVQNLANAFNMTLEELLEGVEGNVSLARNDSIMTIYTQLTSPRQERVYEFASHQLDEQNGIQEEKVVYLVRGRQSAAGSMIHVDDVDAEMGVLPSSIVPNGANELVRITGDSMEPLIKKGSEVYLRYQPTVEDGEVAIVRVEDDGVTCKYLYRDGKNVILKSENPKYEDLIVDAEKVSVIGKVLL
ncbi:helix-turn-helix domain-containing protein [Streptococcus sp. 263_SSPC]|uniref:helix-turn-helix domain-containing protein n=1 Tax=Streptococcus sp. 263_SSPC TaxID=1579343 RepID=UPI00066023D1|nr:XRE family transcriptional regulator [Streptococcus sp. 263_SSPC]